jgi:predicted transcriptional regulator
MLGCDFFLPKHSGCLRSRMPTLNRVFPLDRQPTRLASMEHPQADVGGLRASRFACPTRMANRHGGRSRPYRVTNFHILDVPGKVTSLPLGQKCSYTTGMKTAVSIPEDVFQGAERLARKTKRSRSRLFSDALREYLARHTPDSVTEAMNRACSELGAAKDQFVSSAARRVLERSEW